MMMSMFSVFDALNAESLGQKASLSWPAGLKKEAKVPGSSSSTSSQVSEKKAGASGADGKGKEGTCSLPTKKPENHQRRQRFAVELDGVHCFETIIPY